MTQPATKRRRPRDPDTPEHRPKVRLAHLADEYAISGGACKGDSACKCGGCVAESLRRPLHPRIIVANGATVTPYRKREDS